MHIQFGDTQTQNSNFIRQKIIIRKIRHSPCQSWTDQLCIPNVNNISMLSMPSQNYQCTFFLHIEIHIFRPCDFRHSHRTEQSQQKKKREKKPSYELSCQKTAQRTNNVLFFCIELL